MIRFLWTKIIEPWLAEIADERSRDDGTGWAIALAFFGVMIGLGMLGIAIGAVELLVVLARHAPLTLVILLTAVTLVVGLCWVAWTLAGDGSNDRATR